MEQDPLVEYAKSELERAGYFDKDSDYGGLLGPAVLKMVEQFSDEGHSGYSARIAMTLFEKVAMFEPLTPLTGEDDEWNEIGGGSYQNRRCSHVFKDATGAYDRCRPHLPRSRWIMHPEQKQPRLYHVPVHAEDRIRGPHLTPPSRCVRLA